MLYKEWIKTRWFYAVALLTTFALCGYVLLNINRLMSLKGAATTSGWRKTALCPKWRMSIILR